MFFCRLAHSEGDIHFMRRFTFTINSPSVSQSRFTQLIVRKQFLLTLLLCFLAQLIYPSAINARSARKLALHDLAGHATHLSDYAGHVMVVNFWATWCVPCRQELPRLSLLAQHYATNQVPFILISINDMKEIENIRAFAEREKLDLPVWIGASVELLEHYSGKDIVPATLIIDERGEVIRTINGQARDEDVTEAVDWLLAGKKGGVPTPVIKRY